MHSELTSTVSQIQLTKEDCRVSGMVETFFFFFNYLNITHILEAGAGGGDLSGHFLAREARNEAKL